MKVVVVGDLAYRGRYHLGDEAMSEAALNQLNEGGCEVTFIAGDPTICANFYSTNAVGRFGFADKKSHQNKDDYLAALLEFAANGGLNPDGSIESTVKETIQAIADSDAVIIAGGGNLNSIGVHHVYERVAVKRLAQSFGVPLYVTSQTVGPHLIDPELSFVREIAEYATVFGVRERHSAELMRAISGDKGAIVQTLDDAILLGPIDELESSLSLPERFAVGSFTFHSNTTGLSELQYYSRVARILDDLAVRLDIDFLLLPHMSTFANPNDLGPRDDIYGHQKIAEFSNTGRLRVMPLVSARSLLGITARASFSISTRYHPLVFGASLGVPAVGLVTSYYSAIRMRGALANVGMESFALPFEYFQDLFLEPLAHSLSVNLPKFSQHLHKYGKAQRRFQVEWWNGIIGSIRSERTPHRKNCVEPPSIEWCDSETATLLAQTRIAHEMVNLDRLNKALSDERQERTARLEILERYCSSQERGIHRLRQKLRPPGAWLRDRLRESLKGKHWRRRRV